MIKKYKKWRNIVMIDKKSISLPFVRKNKQIKYEEIIDFVIVVHALSGLCLCSC